MTEHLISKFNHLQSKNIAGVMMVMAGLMEHVGMRELENIINRLSSCQGRANRNKTPAAGTAPAKRRKKRRKRSNTP